MEAGNAGIFVIFVGMSAIFSFLAIVGLWLGDATQPVRATGPDGRLELMVWVEDEQALYAVAYDGKMVLEAAPLGFLANAGDYSKVKALQPVKCPATPEKSSEMKDLQAVEQETQEPGKDPEVREIRERYVLERGKRREVEYVGRELRCRFTTTEDKHFDVVFRLSNNDLAFRYEIPREGERGGIYVQEEVTGFGIPATATAFVCPQSEPMVGWKRTKPSYEEEYRADVPVTEASAYGQGFTFPCLFKTDGQWVLIGETGVDGHYCASHLSDYADGMFRIAFPMAEENDGNGLTGAAFALPGHSPWRTITIGSSLKPIVETTVTWDVVEPRYSTEHDYVFGPGTWSWILWDDASINLEDQQKYVDLAAAMGFKYTLVDNFWDRNIGREKMAELSDYARSKGISLFLWYSSSGYWNDISQSPLNCMDDPIARKKELRWLASIGVKGIKVDFFGGDKQETMRLYEAILSDADDAGLMVIFHGCTLPRGWERMYPNYVGSEAVLASENLRFSEYFCEQEAFNACLHPFIRNSLGSMEFGGCFLNRHYSRDNRSGHPRHTSNAFQLATAVLFQNPVQNFALAPNNLDDAPAACLDFLRQVPTTWDDTVFLDGYPGRYVVLARRKGSRWYVAGVNATGAPLPLEVTPPALQKGSPYTLYEGEVKEAPVTKTFKGKPLKLTLPVDGGFVLVY